MRSIFCIIFIFLSFYIEAAHIIGGEMSYRCLGNGNYEIQMIVYRDCFGGGASFDSPQGSIQGHVSVFRDDLNRPFIETIDIGFPEIERLGVEIDNPCVDLPPNICVERGVYTFEVQLPPSDFDYHISYQRCCRNSTINNIINPDETGATFTIQISAEEQLSCIDGPRFSSFPPIALCLGEPFRIDQSVVNNFDPSLYDVRYSFVAAFDGGGLDGLNVGDPSSVTGLAPNPESPPPYTPVMYNPGFSAQNAIPGNPAIQIDSITGLMTGTPSQEGQFVMAVRASLIDTLGQVFASIQREFQFNVVTCIQRVDARMLAIVDSNGQYQINSCGPNRVIIENQSVEAENIISEEWQVELGPDSLFVSSDKNLEITFPGLGNYSGLLIINKGLSCADTASFEVNVFGEIEAEAEALFDSCRYSPVIFLGRDTSLNTGIMERRWFNAGVNSDEQSFEHLFETPGEKIVYYMVEDSTGCIAFDTVVIDYFPLIDTIILPFESYESCAPATFTFSTGSPFIDEQYDITWDFGDGNTSNELSPSYTYESAGEFKVRVEIVSPTDCEIVQPIERPIIVDESPEANFLVSPSALSQFDESFDVSDQSLRAATVEYEFLNTFYNVRDLTLAVQDTGRIPITQFVVHENGCVDSLIKIIDIVPKTTYFLPNAFTPNEDGLNDLYLGQGDFIGMKNFKMQIFDRYGKLIFESDDPNVGWDGYYQNRKQIGAVFVCAVEYQDARNNWVELRTPFKLVN